MSRSLASPRRAGGFTLVELLVAIGLIGILMSLTMVNLIRPQHAASLSGSVEVLASDLRNQQIKAMSGDTGSGTTAQPHGVYVQSDRYTLFKGSTYSAGDTDNFVIQPEGVTLSTTLASSQVSFQKASGEPSGFNPAGNTITVSDLSGQTKTLTINRYGVVEVN